MVFGIAARYPHDIALVGIVEVLVLVDECLAHAGGMFLVHAEDDRLLKSVAALAQIIGHPFGDELGSLVDDESAVEILLVVFAILDLISLRVPLSRVWPVAFDI